MCASAVSVSSLTETPSTLVTHIVVAKHDSFGLSGSSRRVDQRAALVGLLAGDDGIELVVGFVTSQLHELGPLGYAHKVS